MDEHIDSGPPQRTSRRPSRRGRLAALVAVVGAATLIAGACSAGSRDSSASSPGSVRLGGAGSGSGGPPPPVLPEFGAVVLES